MRGNESGAEGDERERDGRRGEDRRVVALQLKEQRLREMAGADRGRETDRAADDRHDADLPQHHPAHARRRGAERHAQPDLARPLRDRVREHAVEADRRQQRCQRGERRREDADEAIDEHVLLDLFGQRVQVLHRQVGVEPRDELRDVREEGFRLRRGAHIKTDLTGALVLAVRTDEHRRNLLLHLRVLRVPHEPDDLDRQRAVAAIASEIELLRERFVDDRHLRRAERVGAREVAAGNHRDAERLEVAGPDEVEARIGVRVGIGLEAFHRDAVAPVAAAQQRHRGVRHAGDAGQRREIVLDSLEQLA